MVRRFRMIAGPNGSGKSTLVRRLEDDYAVNFYSRSLSHVKEAMPYLSRAFFFDNSGVEMAYLGSFAEGEGYSFVLPAERLPGWFRDLGLREA